MNVILLGNKSKKGWGGLLAEILIKEYHTFFCGGHVFLKVGLYAEGRGLHNVIGEGRGGGA